MCGSHIDTVRTGGRYDGNLGVLGGLEVVQTLNDAGVTTRRAAGRRRVHGRGRRALPPGHGGFARLRRRAAARGAVRHARHRRQGVQGRTAAHRLPRRCAGAAVPAARVRRTAHRAGTGARPRRHHDRRRRRTCRASRGRKCWSPGSRTTPARRRCGCGTTPATAPPRSACSCANSSRRSAAARSAPWARSRCIPT